MAIANLIRLIYALLGAAYLAAGVGILLYRADVLSQEVIYVINQIAHDSPSALHIMQEFGTHLIALGIVALWFAYQYELSWVFQWAMTIGWGLFGLIHYLDVRAAGGGYRNWIYTAIPFVVFLALGVLRWRSERADVY
jgi:hypothetical protein